jgi:zinc protease
MLAAVARVQATSEVTAHDRLDSKEPGLPLAELEQAIDAELMRLQEQGVTEAELQVAQAQVETDQVRALQRPGVFGGTADLLTGT